MTLIELLAVICLVGLLTGVGVPALSSLLRSGDLNAAAQLLSDQMSLARQMALSSNRQIEVRLYRFADPQMSGETTPKFRAIQLFEVPENPTAGTGRSGYRAVTKCIRLPGPSIIVDSGNPLSTLIGSAGSAGTVPSVLSGSELGHALPAVGTAYTAICFSFLPDGSTNLPPQTIQNQWFLTVHEVREGDNLPASPSNFATVQIHPSNGKTRIYRP